MPPKHDAVAEPLRFPPSEPPTLSTRAPSGMAIKGGIVRALSAEHAAIKGCYDNLDELLAALKNDKRHRHV